MDHSYLSVIDEKAKLLEETANFLWENPETAFTEFKSAAHLCDLLRKEGFTVKENLADIRTAFSGSYGSGKPVIGILGEFDALSGLSQEAGCQEQKSIGGEAGHGCGHHLFAAGALGAAIAVKKWLETTGNPGTVVFFGTPSHASNRPDVGRSALDAVELMNVGVLQSGAQYRSAQGALRQAGGAGTA